MNKNVCKAFFMCTYVSNYSWVCHQLHTPDHYIIHLFALLNFKMLGKVVLKLVNSNVNICQSFFFIFFFIFMDWIVIETLRNICSSIQAHCQV